MIGRVEAGERRRVRGHHEGRAPGVERVLARAHQVAHLALHVGEMRLQVAHAGERIEVLAGLTAGERIAADPLAAAARPGAAAR